VDENWMPGDGPWWPLLTGGLPWITFIALVTGFLCYGLGLWRSCMAVACLYFVFGILHGVVNFGSDDVMRMYTYGEGCRSLPSDIASTGLIFGLSILLFGVALRARRRVKP
jgi:uncharacterized membrane protein YiaA